MARARLAFVFLISLSLLAGCGGRSPAPVISRQPPPSQKIVTHIVSEGETLFNIAWRYELDLQKLAAVNGLSQPYSLRVGQRLSLDTSRPVIPSPAPVKPVSKPAPVSSASQPTVSKPSAVKPTQTAPRPSPSPSPSSTATLPKTWQWQWPVKGRVTRGFGASEYFRGIDITSLPGAPVYPAAPGVVVYSGDGLRGYGNLLIVKHSDIYLSAYGHNRKLFVKEGQQVMPDQKIAEVGGDPANVRRFYFEIRKDGKPVDPQKYLP